MKIKYSDHALCSSFLAAALVVEASRFLYQKSVQPSSGVLCNKKGQTFTPVMDQGWAFKSPTEILVDQMQTLVEVTDGYWVKGQQIPGGARERRFF